MNNSTKEQTPATDPAPAVCEWTPEGTYNILVGPVFAAACDGMRAAIYLSDKPTSCASCGKPIRFVEGK